jgi:hypothetical protein
MGLLDRLAPRRTDVELPSSAPLPSVEEPLFATKALRKFLSSLTNRESPALLDLGPVVGSNVSFFGEQLGCKLFVEDVYAEIERHRRAGTLDKLPDALTRRFTQPDRSIDGIICWDILDFLDKASAQALGDQLTRVLKPEGALLGFFGALQPREMSYTKFIIVDDANLKHRPYGTPHPYPASLANRDIIRLFSGLRVSDSYLMKSNVRELLFRKPTYETR